LPPDASTLERRGELTALRAANLTVRFALELCALAALGYWGVHTGGSTVVKVALAVVTVAAAAGVWGVFVSPKAPLRERYGSHVVGEAAVFGGAVAALATSGHAVLAAVFAAVAVASHLLPR
jgi:hypothetical protein